MNLFPDREVEIERSSIDGRIDWTHRDNTWKSESFYINDGGWQWPTNGADKSGVASMIEASWN